MPVPLSAKAFAPVRASIGVGAIAAPRLAGRLFGFPADQLTPATEAIAGMFGAREIALGGVTLALADEKKVLWANAAVDALDAAVIVALARRHRSLRTAAVLVVPVALASVALHVKAALEAKDAGVPA